MKRWMWLLSAVLVVGLLGQSGEKLEELKPVQLLYVRKDGNRISVRTDTGDFGEGDTLPLALADLQSGTAGRIFLETADLLVLSREAESLLPQMGAYLRPAAMVCRAEYQIEPAEAADYLRIHRPGITLGMLRRKSCSLPVLKLEKGRMKLCGNDAAAEKTVYHRCGGGAHHSHCIRDSLVSVSSDFSPGRGRAVPPF